MTSRFVTGIMILLVAVIVALCYRLWMAEKKLESSESHSDRLIETVAVLRIDSIRNATVQAELNHDLDSLREYRKEKEINHEKKKSAIIALPPDSAGLLLISRLDSLYKARYHTN